MSTPRGKRYNIYIGDPKLVKDIEEWSNTGLGRSKSKVCEEAFRLVLDNEELIPLNSIMDLSMIKRERKRIQRMIRSKEGKILDIEESINEDRQALKDLAEKEERIKEHKKKLEQARRLSEVFKTLNRVCLDQQFNYRLIEETTREIVEEIKLTLPLFDLKKHIERNKEILGR